MITNKVTTTQISDDEDDIEIFQIYLQIEPTSLISSMSEERFREWLCTNEYGIIEKEPNEEYLKEILGLLHNHPHMRNYENIVLEMLIKS